MRAMRARQRTCRTKQLRGLRHAARGHRGRRGARGAAAGQIAPRCCERLRSTAGVSIRVAVVPAGSTSMSAGGAPGVGERGPCGEHQGGCGTPPYAPGVRRACALAASGTCRARSGAAVGTPAPPPLSSEAVPRPARPRRRGRPLRGGHRQRAWTAAPARAGPVRAASPQRTCSLGAGRRRIRGTGPVG